VAVAKRPQIGIKALERGWYLVEFGVKDWITGDPGFVYEGRLLAPMGVENVNMEAGELVKEAVGYKIKGLVSGYGWDSFRVRAPFILGVKVRPEDPYGFFDVLVNDKVVRSGVKRHVFIRALGIL